jgi:hypothetical protein
MYTLTAFSIFFGWFMVFYDKFQQYFSYIVAVSFIGGTYAEKTTDLPQVTDKLYHIKALGNDIYLLVSRPSWS